MEERITSRAFPFSFRPGACASCRGECCRGAPGQVLVDRARAKEMASWLGLSLDDFGSRYLRRLPGGRLSLTETRRGSDHACVFLDPDSGRCAVYPVRPSQCRSFPFWPELRGRVEELARACPGVQPASGAL